MACNGIGDGQDRREDGTAGPPPLAAPRARDKLVHLAAPASYRFLASKLDDSELYERSPFLVKLKRGRLAPIRLQQLLQAARGEKPPREPDPWDCCDSSCKPCVKTLWKEEMRVWNEIHRDGGNVEKEEEDGDVDAGIASLPAKGDAEPRLGDSEGSIRDESDGTSVHLTTNRRTRIL